MQSSFFTASFYYTQHRAHYCTVWISIEYGKEKIIIISFRYMEPDFSMSLDGKLMWASWVAANKSFTVYISLEQLASVYCWMNRHRGVRDGTRMRSLGWTDVLQQTSLSYSECGKYLSLYLKLSMKVKPVSICHVWLCLHYLSIVIVNN